MAFTRSVRNGMVMIVAVGLLVAAVWLVASNQARAASSTPVVYVVTGENFPDALGAGPVAAMVKGPVLLVRLDSIPPATASELTRLSPDIILIVGGSGVISDDVWDSLRAFAPVVERISGADRYETAAALSANTYPASLDADTLNGKDSSAFLGKTDKAADSNLLDGNDSSAFLGATAKATDSDLLNGKHSSVLVPRAAFATSTDLPDGTGVSVQVMLSTEITAPARGVLLINATVDAFANVPAIFDCLIAVDTVNVTGSLMWAKSDGAGNSSENCTTVAARNVNAGTHTVLFHTNAPVGVGLDDATLTVLWVPFDGTGNTPP